MAGDPTQRIVDLQPAAIHGDERHADRSVVERALEALAHLLQASLDLSGIRCESLALGDFLPEPLVGGSELALVRLEFVDPASLGHAGR